MKNGKTLHRIIGCAVVMLSVFVFTGTGYTRSGCNTCQPCGQPDPPPPPVVEKGIELQYRDGFPGPRRYKRQQVKKLQCMLRALGYCSGPIDGWYGHSTNRAVMLFLADNYQVIGYGEKVTEQQWDYLERWAGERCSEYDKEEEPKPDLEPEPKPCTSCGEPEPKPCISCGEPERPYYDQYRDYRQEPEYRDYRQDPQYKGYQDEQGYPYYQQQN